MGRPKHGCETYPPAARPPTHADEGPNPDTHRATHTTAARAGAGLELDLALAEGGAEVAPLGGEVPMGQATVGRAAAPGTQDPPPSPLRTAQLLFGKGSPQCPFHSIAVVGYYLAAVTLAPVAAPRWIPPLRATAGSEDPRLKGRPHGGHVRGPGAPRPVVFVRIRHPSLPHMGVSLLEKIRLAGGGGGCLQFQETS